MAICVIIMITMCLNELFMTISMNSYSCVSTDRAEPALLKGIRCSTVQNSLIGNFCTELCCNFKFCVTNVEISQKSGMI